MSYEDSKERMDIWVKSGTKDKLKERAAKLKKKSMTALAAEVLEKEASK
jgi:hypothetical protein